MSKSKLLGFTMLGVASAAIALPQAAQAQRVDRIVAFGDSYADDGNAFELSGVNPISTVVYPTGRFSGGSNYIDTLSQLLDAPIDNFAIGGAQANGGNVNAGLPGFGFEVGAFLSGGVEPMGVPDAFPSVSGTFDEDDLVAVSIGGNDARSFQLNGGTMAGLDVAVAQSVAGATAGLDALVGAGARNISFLYGNTADLPEVAAQPDPASAFAIRDAYSESYGQGVRQALSGYAANGVMVHYLDLSVVADNIADNLAAFGFDGISCPAFNPADQSTLVCALDASVADNFVFYGDGVHLTSAGFEVVARYVAAQLQAPLTFDAPSEVAMENAQAITRALGHRIASLAPRDGDYAEGLHFFVQGDGFTRSTPITQTQDRLALNGIGGMAGLEYGFGNGMIGIAGRYARSEGEYGNGAAATETDSYTGTLYAAYALGPIFAQGYAGIGRDEHDIDRAGVMPMLSLSADADGDHFLAGGKLGYLTNWGAMRIGPVVGLDYVDISVDDYDESGDDALALRVSDVDYTSMRGQLGLEARGDFAGYGVPIRPYLFLGAEQEFDGDARTYNFAQFTSPEIVNSFTTEDRDDDIYGRASVGFGARILGGVMMNAAASYSLWRDDGNDASAQLGFTLGF